MQLELNREQLELLKFMVLHYEYDDDKEREVVEQLEFKLYEAEDKDSEAEICLESSIIKFEKLDSQKELALYLG